MAIQQRGRSGGAQAEAEDGFERDRAVRCRAVPVHGEGLADVTAERFGADRLAGLGAAEMEHVAAGRHATEIVIERDDAMHLGSADVQCGGDQRFGVERHAAKYRLQSVQDRQTGALKTGIVGDDGAGAILVPWLETGHSVPPGLH